MKFYLTLFFLFLTTISILASDEDGSYPGREITDAMIEVTKNQYENAKKKYEIGLKIYPKDSVELKKLELELIDAEGKYETVRAIVKPMKKYGRKYSKALPHSGATGIIAAGGIWDKLPELGSILWYLAGLFLIIGVIYYILDYFEILPSFSSNKKGKEYLVEWLRFLQNNLIFFKEQFLNRINDKPWKKNEFLGNLKNIIKDKFIQRRIDKLIRKKVIDIIEIIEEFNKDVFNNKLIDKKILVLDTIDKIVKYCEKRIHLLK